MTITSKIIELRNQADKLVQNAISKYHMSVQDVLLRNYPDDTLEKTDSIYNQITELEHEYPYSVSRSDGVIVREIDRFVDLKSAIEYANTLQGKIYVDKDFHTLYIKEA